MYGLPAGKKTRKGNITGLHISRYMVVTFILVMILLFLMKLR